MKLLRTLPATLAVALAAVAGCSAGGQASGGAQPAADLAGRTVEVVGVWSDKEQANFQKVLDAFARKTGVKVNYTSVGDELPTVLQTRIAGGSPPDVALVSQPALVASLAKAGTLTPLDAGIERVLDTQYAPVWKQLGTVDGRLYGLVYKGANKSTVWYNKKSLGAGRTPPRTLDEFVGELAQLSDEGRTALSIGAGDGWTLTDWFENVYLQTAGPDRYDALAKHKIPWTDPSVRAAFAELAKVWQPRFLPGGTAGALQTEFPTSVENVFGDKPTADITFEGDFVAGVIKDSTKSVVGSDADFFPFPAGGGPIVVAGGDTAVVLSKNPAAQALLAYLADAEGAGVWAGLGGFLSPNKNVPTSAYPDPVTQALAGQLARAQTVRFDMSDLMPTALGGTKGRGFWKACQDILADPAKLDAILVDLEAQN
jgi:alpha-glucoside transport system substrate-binding protein